jgi:hypothetical protein
MPPPMTTSSDNGTAVFTANDGTTCTGTKPKLCGDGSCRDMGVSIADDEEAVGIDGGPGCQDRPAGDGNCCRAAIL